jgi:hypothetical protein
MLFMNNTNEQPINNNLNNSAVIPQVPNPNVQPANVPPTMQPANQPPQDVVAQAPVTPAAPVAPVEAAPAQEPAPAPSGSTKIVLDEDPIIKPIEASNISLASLTGAPAPEKEEAKEEMPKEQTGNITF